MTWPACTKHRRALAGPPPLSAARRRYNYRRSDFDCCDLAQQRLFSDRHLGAQRTGHCRIRPRRAAHRAAQFHPATPALAAVSHQCLCLQCGCRQIVSDLCRNQTIFGEERRASRSGLLYLRLSLPRMLFNVCRCNRRSTVLCEAGSNAVASTLTSSCSSDECSSCSSRLSEASCSGTPAHSVVSALR